MTIIQIRFVLIHLERLSVGELNSQLHKDYGLQVHARAVVSVAFARSLALMHPRR